MVLDTKCGAIPITDPDHVIHSPECDGLEKHGTLCRKCLQLRQRLQDVAKGIQKSVTQRTFSARQFRNVPVTEGSMKAVLEESNGLRKELNELKAQYTPAFESWKLELYERVVKLLASLEKPSFLSWFIMQQCRHAVAEGAKQRRFTDEEIRF